MLDHYDEKELNLAVLIDAENVPAKYIKEMMEEIAKNGTSTIKRIYGDWTSDTINNWKKCLLENAITPIQQYSYTTGKNSSDSALIIDAMDILYSKPIDGFCLVTSDSDFTRLATRLREAGKKVFGFGEQKTPRPFITSCDKFIYLESLKENASNELPNHILKLIAKCYDQIRNKDGWTNLGAFGSKLSKTDPSFNSQNYGYKNLSELVEETNLFEIRKEGKDVKKIDIKLKEQKVKEIPDDVIKLIIATYWDKADEDGWAYLGLVGSLIQKRKSDFDSSNYYGYKTLTKLIQGTNLFEIERREANNNSHFKNVYLKLKED